MLSSGWEFSFTHTVATMTLPMIGQPAATLAAFDPIVLIMRWVHLLSAMAAIGGAMYAAVAFWPASADLPEGERDKLREAARRRWAMVVHLSITLLIVTGLFNFYWLAIRPGHLGPMPYHAVFGVKFLLAMVVFALASVLVGRSPGLAGVRAQAGKWLRVIVVLGVVIVFLSGVLYQTRTAVNEEAAKTKVEGSTSPAD